MTATLPPPQLDPTAAFPELAQLRAAVVARDWPAVTAFLGQVARTRDAADLTYAARFVGEIDGSEGFLEEVAADEASSTLARTLFATRLIEIGWRARTNARAKHVSREQFEAFHGYLRRAERILIEVTAVEPQNLTAWTLRLITARGLELGQSEARRRYDQAAKHHPNYLPAQSQLLQQLCPKWSGNWDAMYEFARGCVRTAPEGALNGVLIADAHLERWMDLGGGDAGAAYLRQPEVREEVAAAATRSVLHPAFRPTYQVYSIHGYFAMIFSLIGDHRAAAAHFHAMGNFVYKYPWAYLGDPAEVFQRRRAEALEKGASA